MADSMQTVTAGELDQRVAIITRLRQALVRQREKFRSYLDLLDKENTTIRSGDTDKLEQQVQLERAMVQDITSLQKVIDPLQDLYRHVVGRNDRVHGGGDRSGRETSYGTDNDLEIESLRKGLETLRQNVTQKNRENQTLLEQQMAALKERIESVRIPAGNRSVFAENPEPSLVDIST